MCGVGSASEQPQSRGKRSPEGPHRSARPCARRRERQRAAAVERQALARRAAPQSETMCAASGAPASSRSRAASARPKGCTAERDHVRGVGSASEQPQSSGKRSPEGPHRRARPCDARRGWDSNPRWVAPHTLSKRADSAALAPLPGAAQGTGPVRWPTTRRSGPVQRLPVNRVRAGRQQLSAERVVCRRPPGRRVTQDRDPSTPDPNWAWFRRLGRSFPCRVRSWAGHDRAPVESARGVPVPVPAIPAPALRGGAGPGARDASPAQRGG
jgi:hypothetical protein